MQSPAILFAIATLLGIPRGSWQPAVLPSRSLTVTFTTAAPSNAVPLSPTLLSFSIEQDRWPEWVGTDAPNTFFLNALSNLATLAGEPPCIRIGADSEDHTNFDAAIQFSEAQFPPPTEVSPYPEAKSILVSQSYYNLASLLPSGTKVTWGVNLGESNMSALHLGAAAIASAFQSDAVKSAGVTLDAIEVGNEPDLYGFPTHGLRPTNFSVQQYLQQWIPFATNATATVNGALGVQVPLQALSFAKSTHNLMGFSPQLALQSGLLQSPVGKEIQRVSQHHYQGSSSCKGSVPQLPDLMTKANIRSNLTSFLPDIAAVRAHGLTYVLGETNSFACHGAPGVSDTAGAALWALDYTMYAAQIGIERLYFHHGIGFRYNFIQPVTLNRSISNGLPLVALVPAHIQPPYYAAVIAAEAIGSSGSTTASILDITDDFVSGYAFYESGRLSRALLINLKTYAADSFDPRGSVNITLSFGNNGTASGSVSVKRLSIPFADATAGLTWGGQSYETDDATVSGDLSTDTISISDGLTLSDTEAVLLTFD